ncbi:FAD-dependent oxidoreductase [Janibacter alkaliphilus]|uniref:Glycine/D-amino acid oxidase-like deaminating enzyme n=1 Tax=Janibacter alkaliphilus TaxID=1069963 RepID=A0A852X075_9MICO|nr:glycine/D-amino acid oxidase-like deaminating enzyme [Janibacter alkaliphilus]
MSSPFVETHPTARAQRALADARPAVYWTDRPQLRPDPRPPLTGGGHRADLVVVGAGYTGLWTAVQALEENPGRRVVVLDGGPVAIAASGRNGGFASPSLTHGLAQGLGLWPQDMPTIRRLEAENLAGWHASIDGAGIDAEVHTPGEVTFALREHEVDDLAEAVAEHREHGIEAELLDVDACRAVVDSPLPLAGMRDPSVGLVDPARLAWGLAAHAERLGAQIHEGTEVLGLERAGTGVEVRTRWGSIRADKVVLGTGAFRGLLRRSALFTLPVYDHVLMSEPLSATQLAQVGWSGREGLTDAGNQFHYYRRTLDDRVLFGGYDANYHFPGRIDPALEQAGDSHALLAEHFLTLFPQLEGVRFTHRWAGVIDTTSRFTPVFGRALGGRVAYAIGYTGLGVVSTRFGARVALDLVDGVESERTSLAMVRRPPVPFPPEPLRWAAVRATRGALARADRTGRRGPLLATMDRFGVGFDS